jgi:hypothetical protein
MPAISLHSFLFFNQVRCYLMSTRRSINERA